MDHYNTLGVVSTASAADLRSAYLALARANHPDRFEGKERDQAQARMQQINEAWNVLGVAHKRREYDASRPGDREPSAHGDRSRRGRTHFRPFDDDPIVRPDIDLDTTPIPGSKGIPRWVTFLPIGLFVGGLVVAGFGTLVGAGGIFALGGAMLISAAVVFLLLPLIVMSRAERDPHL